MSQPKGGKRPSESGRAGPAPHSSPKVKRIGPRVHRRQEADRLRDVVDKDMEWGSVTPGRNSKREMNPVHLRVDSEVRRELQ